MAENKSIKEENITAEQAKREKRREISLSPLKLFADEFTEGLEDQTDIELGIDEIRARCFEVLHLIDEYYRPPKSKEEFEAIQGRFSADDTADVDSYLDGATGKKDGSTGNFPEKHKKIIVRKIRAILQLPQVREKLFGELQKEAGYYESNKEMLERLKKLRRVQLKTAREMHEVYFESKKQHKKLTASAQERIKNLTELEKKAKQEEQKIVGKAQAENGPALGLITAQELLRYKRQMQERGFALTKSRQELLKHIIEHAMAGRKVFLVGSTGTGKTELAFYAANELTGDYELIPWHEGTTPRDILGQMQIQGGKGGTVESSFKPGPMPRAYAKGKALVHEEITGGSTRTMLGIKPYLNLKPGQKIKIPEMNGEILEVGEAIVEFFTGNPKDERTKEREELDPAILRMLKGIHVQYMPADEMAKIALASLIEESGVLELSKEEVEFIQHLADAAYLMQQCHDGNIPKDAEEELKKATGLEDLRITKNFLDPGTFFALFSKYDFEKARGRPFKDYIAEQLQEFVNDPKTLGAEEEKKTLLAILKLKTVVSETSTFDTVETQIPQSPKNYLLPSELGFLNAGEGVFEEDEFASEEEKITAGIHRELLDAAKRFPGGPPLPPDQAELLRGFEQQFGERLDELDGFGIIDKANPKIKGIDDKNYPAPTWEKVKAALTPEKIRLISQLENPTLLLVPDGMSLNEYAAKAGADKTAPKRKLQWSKWTDIELDSDKQGTLISDAVKYEKITHGGKTKTDRLKQPGALGWQVIVVDGGDEVPADTLNKSADDLRAQFLKQGFGGLSAESNFALQMYGQVRGKQFDIQKWEWLLESYLTTIDARGVVLYSDWYGSRVALRRDVPGSSDGRLGARRSVRIL